jgi:hypothetical protein
MSKKIETRRRGKSESDAKAAGHVAGGLEGVVLAPLLEVPQIRLKDMPGVSTEWAEPDIAQTGPVVIASRPA